MSEFQEFPKIARLSRECVITEKIDGTNAQIHIAKGSDMLGLGISIDKVICRDFETDLYMMAGSRSQYITTERDNFTFAAWVEEHASALWQLGEGRHYGEWWGSGIQRGYGLTNGEKRFSLFNVARWADERNREKVPIDRPWCCGVVPVLYRGNFTTDAVAEMLQRLNVGGSKAAPGFMKPEGVVVFHTAASLMFKKTLEKDAESKQEAERRIAI